jgi:dipeptide/tripeptide permease
MKSLVNAAFLLMTASGAAIAMALAPIAKDPGLGDMYLGLGVTAGVAGAGFWWCFSGLKIEGEKEEKGEEVEMAGMRVREDG